MVHTMNELEIESSPTQWRQARSSWGHQIPDIWILYILILLLLFLCSYNNIIS